MEKVPMTGEGYKSLDDELKRLKSIERPSVIAAISEARSPGDLSENAEYHAAKERQGWIEGRIAEIEDKIRRGAKGVKSQFTDCGILANDRRLWPLYDYLQAHEIPLQSKIMTIADIYDALTARDRPYKKAMPADRALGILDLEVKSGHVDDELVRIFREAEIFREVEKNLEY